jgi:hypothetical protein
MNAWLSDQSNSDNREFGTSCVCVREREFELARFDLYKKEPMQSSGNLPYILQQHLYLAKVCENSPFDHTRFVSCINKQC